MDIFHHQEHRRESLYTAVDPSVDEEHRLAEGQKTPTATDALISQLSEMKMDQVRQVQQHHRQWVSHLETAINETLSSWQVQRSKDEQIQRAMRTENERLRAERASAQGKANQLQRHQDGLAAALTDFLTYRNGIHATEMSLESAIQQLVTTTETLVTENETMRNQNAGLQHTLAVLQQQLKSSQHHCDLQAQEMDHYRTTLSQFENEMLYMQHLMWTWVDDVYGVQQICNARSASPWTPLTVPDSEFQRLSNTVHRLLTCQSIPQQHHIHGHDVPMDDKDVDRILPSVSLRPFQAYAEIDDILDRGEHLSDNAHLFQWPTAFLIKQLRTDLEHDLNAVGLQLKATQK